MSSIIVTAALAGSFAAALGMQKVALVVLLKAMGAPFAGQEGSLPYPRVAEPDLAR